MGFVTVFTDLFRDKKYTLQLYKALHPEDKSVTAKDIKKYTLQLYKALHPEDKSVTAKDIKIVTLKAIVVNDIYNDLGMIIKDKIIFLLES